jgi:hypothetical protein
MTTSQRRVITTSTNRMPDKTPVRLTSLSLSFIYSVITDLTESSAILTPTSKTTQATSTIFTPTQQAPGSSSPSSSAAHSTNTIPDRNVNVVGGVVVGGLLGLSLLSGLLYWYFKRRNHIAGHGVQLASPTYSISPNDSWHREGPYTRQIIGSAPQISASAVPSLASLVSCLALK